MEDKHTARVLLILLLMFVFGIILCCTPQQKSQHKNPQHSPKHIFDPKIR